MRLNWFLPSRGKSKSGVVRRILRRLGPTWLASPGRRLIQSIGLLGFLVLFGYVCWPYTSRPVDVSSLTSQSWSDWTPIEFDSQSGNCIVVSDTSSLEAGQVGMTVRVRDDGPDAAAGELGTFRVERIDNGDVGLSPVNPIPPQRLDALSANFGPWSLEEIPQEQWPSHYSDGLANKEIVEAELVLALDPLVGLSTSLASRTWVWSLTFACVLLAVCLIVPRGFCGYICPLGTFIDLFDWTAAPLKKLFGSDKETDKPTRGGEQIKDRPWWVRIKYYLLSATLAASLGGVLLAGFVAAIPLLTRGLAYLITPLQTGLERGWHQVPSMNGGQFLSLGLLAGVFLLGLAKRRFWCKYVCPSGAVFSVANLVRLTGRKVQANCVACGRCVEVCPFDAIREDYGTRGADCTFCQTCGGACPVGAITFVGRWTTVEGELAPASPSGPTANRRDFLTTSLGVVGGATGGLAAGAAVGATDTSPIVRPPGSLPEAQFLRTCIRCGECLQACPNDVLQPAGLEQGVEGLWAPRVVADWSGCEVSCNNCGQVCPTGAIRAIPLEEKRNAKMGLAVVNEKTCLPYAGVEECQLCVDECTASGYDAIEFRLTGSQMDDQGNPIEGAGFLAPVVLADKCVGCGLCQTRCRAINVAGKGLLGESAILLEVGPGKEDRLAKGSYLQLREEEKRLRDEQRKKRTSGSDGGYRTDFLDIP